MRKVSIIIPVYNEERTIVKVISSVNKLKIGNASKEIIVVDDFSTDNTRSILKKIKNKSIKVFYHTKNMGKGAAIRTALAHSTGNIIAIQDADLEYDPQNIAKLTKLVISNDADVVYGTRFANINLVLFGKNKTPLPLHLIGNKALTFLTNILYFNSITDMETGCKIFKKTIIKGMKLKAKRFDFEPEITAKILKRGYKIMEVPIVFKPRGFEEGKKITWRDGIKAAYFLLKYRFFD